MNQPGCGASAAMSMRPHNTENLGARVMEDVLTQIEQWYKSNCNGLWEHQFGLRIETLDNPGLASGD
jgi:hypothetical protein